MGSSQFTLWDVIKQTVHLTRARKTCLLLIFSAYFLAFVASQGLGNYFSYMSQRNRAPVSSQEDKDACIDTIILPWMRAASSKNLSASQQDEFYKSFKINCTMLEDPPRGWGTYIFRNGSFSYNPTFALTEYRKSQRHAYALNVLLLLSGLSRFWGLVAIAWVLHDATTNTPSDNNRPLQHRDSISTTRSRTLLGLFLEQFSGKVIRGVIRLALTLIVIGTLYALTDSLEASVRMVLVKRILNPKIQAMNTMWESLSLGLRIQANPLRFLFMLWMVVTGLESGMWGFKALLRVIQLMKGNYWRSFVIYLLLILWAWPILYIRAITLKSVEQMKEPFSGLLWMWMTAGILKAVKDIPEFLLLPVLYFFCTSLSEKVATMA